MLAQQYRLRSAADITRVYKRGVYGGSGGVLSVKAVNFGRPLSRLVVVVGKKVSKRAVTRNRIRRRIIESLRSRWATVLPGYDIVLSVHTDVSKMAKIILQEHLEKALKRAGV